jgi:hypothetical protein
MSPADLNHEVVWLHRLYAQFASGMGLLDRTFISLAILVFLRKWYHGHLIRAHYEAKVKTGQV